MKDKAIVTCVALLSVSILEGIALIMGLDGAMFGACIASISGLGGFVIGSEIRGEKVGGRGS